MPTLTKYYRLIISWDNIIQNVENYKDKCTGTLEFLDTYFYCVEFDTIGQMNKYIKDNKLTFRESIKNEINPFDSEWSTDYPDAKIRLFMYANDCIRLSINVPEFVFKLKQLNINLIPDEDYGGAWAYLQYIEDNDRAFLAASKEDGGYNAIFEGR